MLEVLGRYAVHPLLVDVERSTRIAHVGALDEYALDERAVLLSAILVLVGGCALVFLVGNSELNK